MKERDDVDLNRPDYGLEVVQQVDSHVRRGGRWRNLLTVAESEQAEAAEAAGPKQLSLSGAKSLSGAASLVSAKKSVVRCVQCSLSAAAALLPRTKWQQKEAQEANKAKDSIDQGVVGIEQVKPNKQLELKLCCLLLLGTVCCSSVGCWIAQKHAL